MVGWWYVTGGRMGMQSVWRDCSKFDGLLVFVPPVWRAVAAVDLPSMQF